MNHYYLSGRHFIGLTYDFYLYPTTPQEVFFTKKAGEDTAKECTACIRSRLIDGNVTIIEAWVQYSIHIENLTELFISFRSFERLQDRLVSVIRTNINDAVSRNDRGFIYAQSHAISLQIEELFKKRLLLYFVTVLDFDLLSIEFPDAFAQAHLDAL